LANDFPCTVTARMDATATLRNGAAMNGLMSPTKESQEDRILFWRRLYLSKAKLKATSRTSGLMSGFAMVAMVEIQFETDEATKPPLPIVVIFSCLTTILISVHVFALMISVCILPNIETAEALSNLEKQNNERTSKDGGSSSGGSSSSSTPHPSALLETLESPHDRLRIYIETAWVFSTGMGTLLFLIEIPVLMYIKLWHISPGAVYSSIGIMVPVCIVFIIFASHFYRKLVEQKYYRSSKKMEELEIIATELTRDDQMLIDMEKRNFASTDNA